MPRRRLLILLPVCLFLICSASIYLALLSVDTADSDGTQQRIVQGPKEERGHHFEEHQDIELKRENQFNNKPKSSQTHPKDTRENAGRENKRENKLLARQGGRNRTTTLPKSKKTAFNKDAIGLQKPSSGSPTIPHIIHQIWDTRDIPGYLEYWVRSWKQKNPHWQYWLWTLEDGSELIKRAFPSYYPLYEAYTEDIFRIDALRLFVLYAFGGVYVDIDMISLKPLDTWTYEHQCVLTQETYEHSFIVEEKNRTNVVNGFLACRPHHPFLKMTLESLHEAAGRYNGDFLHATGPFFVDFVYRRFDSTRHSKEDSLTVVPPKYFLPTFDPTQEGVVSYKCAPSRYMNLSPEGQAVCKDLWHKDYKNHVLPESYTDHKWLHLYMYDPSWKTKNTKPLLDIVPKAHNVQEVVANISEPVLSEK